MSFSSVLALLITIVKQLVKQSAKQMPIPMFLKIRPQTIIIRMKSTVVEIVMPRIFLLFTLVMTLSPYSALQTEPLPTELLKWPIREPSKYSSSFSKPSAKNLLSSTSLFLDSSNHALTPVLPVGSPAILLM